MVGDWKREYKRKCSPKLYSALEATKLVDGIWGHAQWFEETYGTDRAKQYVNIVSEIDSIASHTADELGLAWGDFWGYRDTKADPVILVYNSLEKGDISEAKRHLETYKQAIDTFKKSYRKHKINEDNANEIFHGDIYRNLEKEAAVQRDKSSIKTGIQDAADMDSKIEKLVEKAVKKPLVERDGEYKAKMKKIMDALAQI